MNSASASAKHGRVAPAVQKRCVRVCVCVLGFVPSVAVGVVGIGHVPGIIANWNQLPDIEQLLQ